MNVSLVLLDLLLQFNIVKCSETAVWQLDQQQELHSVSQLTGEKGWTDQYLRNQYLDNEMHLIWYQYLLKSIDFGDLFILMGLIGRFFSTLQLGGNLILFVLHMKKS